MATATTMKKTTGPDTGPDTDSDTTKTIQNRGTDCRAMMGTIIRL